MVDIWEIIERACGGKIFASFKSMLNDTNLLPDTHSRCFMVIGDNSLVGEILGNLQIGMEKCRC